MNIKNPIAYDAKRVRELDRCLTAYFKLLQKRYADNPDMKYKLREHMAIVNKIAEGVYPDNPLVIVAAKAHDIGRGKEHDIVGSFTGTGDNDHHVLGVTAFKELMAAYKITPSPESEAITLAIRWHGFDQLKDKDGNRKPAPGLDEASDEMKLLVRIITKIDDAANGMNAPFYLLREQQEHAKRVSAGGFIPDENMELKKVSPECMEAFEEGISFNRNAMCKTYPDYFVFAAFLLNRSLKDEQLGPFVARALTENTGAIQMRDKAGELKTVEFASALDAYKATFEVSMNAETAKRATGILETAISAAQAKLPKQDRLSKKVKFMTPVARKKMYEKGVAELKENLFTRSKPRVTSTVKLGNTELDR